MVHGFKRPYLEGFCGLPPLANHRRTTEYRDGNFNPERRKDLNLTQKVFPRIFKLEI